MIDPGFPISFQVLRISFMRLRRQSLFVICFVIITLAIAVAPALANNAAPLSKTRIIVGGEIEYPPYSFLDKNGEATGFSVDLTRAIAKAMGMNVEIRLRPWSETRKALEDGTVDIIPGMFYSEERAKIFDFSPPFSIVSVAIFARTNSPSVKSIEDLRDKEIIVMRGEVMHDYILKHRLTDRILLAEKPGDALRMLASEKGDYALVARMPGFYWIKELKLTNVKAVGPSLQPFKNCFAVRKGEKILLSPFSEGLSIINQTGEYSKLYEKWLGVLEPTEITLGLAIKYTAIVFVPLILILAVFLLWTSMLRTKVNEKTKALQESTERFRSLVSNIPGIVYRCANDSNWTMQYLSGEIATVSDYPASDFINNTVRSYASIIHPDDRDLVDQAVKKGVNEKAAYFMEYRICRADGHVRWVHEQGRAVFAPNGSLLWLDGVILDITGLKQAEEALRKSESIKRTMVSNIGDVIVIIDQNGINQYKSPNVTKLFGWKPEELVGENTWNNIHPEDLEAGQKFFGTIATEPNANGTTELRYKRKDGDYVWIEINVTNLLHDKDIQGILGNYRDITERKRIEKALWESENRFQKMLSLIPDMVSIHDKDMNILYSNWNGFGAVPAEKQIMKTKCYRTYRAYDVICPDCQAKTVFETRKTYRAEAKLSDGVWIDLRVIPMLDEHGQVESFVEWVKDITDWKQAEETLRESEEKHRRLFETMSQGVVYQTGDLEIMSANPAAERILGLSFEQISGKATIGPRWKMIKEDGSEVPGTEQPAMIALRTGQPVGPVIRGVFHPEKNAYIWLNITAIPFFQPGETKPVRVYSTFEDITKKKQAEAEREKLQAQLSQAQKMESVGQLAGGVAHDFNNMLGVILGYAELAMEKVAPTEPLHADLEVIQKAAQRSADLTRQLLAFARKQTVAPRVLDLNDTIESILKLLRRLIGEDVDILWKPGHGLWPVKIDPTQIDQILANLCVNARDAIADVGKVTIETDNAGFDEDYCARHAGFVPGDYVLLSVSDNGCGMDAEMISHIFEPFFTTKKQGKGTGLGLSSVYGAVKQNNGFVNVYSEPGYGTTFKIYLPRSAVKAAETEETKPRAAKRGNETVLLVEDESAILRMITIMLERLGYNVLAAPTPGEAIRLAQEHTGRIDLVMTDVVMPEMNGRELAKNLLSIFPDIQWLFMSGYTANAIAHHGVLDEGVNFIQKPFSMNDLGTKIRETLA